MVLQSSKTVEKITYGFLKRIWKSKINLTKPFWRCAETKVPTVSPDMNSIKGSSNQNLRPLMMLASTWESGQTNSRTKPKTTPVHLAGSTVKSRILLIILRSIRKMIFWPKSNFKIDTTMLRNNLRKALFKARKRMHSLKLLK